MGQAPVERARRVLHRIGSTPAAAANGLHARSKSMERPCSKS
ncbi:hypothetical protein LC55x_3760 [Lysobacter capsici]|nr:hypothetical protein LC55x_3760 [Lysobacter capsici]